MIHGMIWYIQLHLSTNQQNMYVYIYSNWVIGDNYGDGSHCTFFRDCSFAGRTIEFCKEDDCWFATEGICGANTCYKDGHCGMTINHKL